MRSLHALGWTTTALIVRLLREGFVIRSLVWPPALSVFALGGTALIALALARPPRAGLDPTVASLEPALVADGFQVLVTTDPRAAAVDGRVDVATDGRAVWGRGAAVLGVERVVRRSIGASWAPAPAPEHADPAERGRIRVLLPRLVGILYALYGAVFGLASVARDRDDGTLEAELALPVARWVPGAARWVAASVVLGGAIAANVLLYGAILGTDAGSGLIRAGWAAAGGAVALGLGVVGTHGLDRGLSGPLSVALVGVTALIGLGVAVPDVGTFLPIASLVVPDSGGWTSVIGAAGAGVAASVLFAFRSARA